MTSPFPPVVLQAQRPLAPSMAHAIFFDHDERELRCMWHDARELRCMWHDAREISAVARCASAARGGKVGDYDTDQY